MSKKKKISTSIEEAKLRVELYNNLCDSMRNLSYDDRRNLMQELEHYVIYLNSRSRLDLRLFLRYVTCCQAVFHYLYKTKQIDRDGGIDPEIRKHINDVFITILKDYGAD